MMFPSNSCNGDDQSFFCRPFFSNNDIPNSKQLIQQQDPLLPLPSPTSLSTGFLYFPFEQEEGDLLLLQELQQVSENAFADENIPAAAAVDSSTDSAKATTTMSVRNHMISSDQNKNKANTKLVIQQQQQQQQIPRKRSSKRDRHSKINTARGPRDRRMRLSLEVALQFFGLQDMLGFDKASKTVEWLMVQAKPEIKKLTRELKQHHHHSTTASSSSDCCTEVDEAAAAAEVDGGGGGRRCGRKSSTSKQGKKGRKNAIRPVASRESRDKARARARERTKQRNESAAAKTITTQEINPGSGFGSSWSPLDQEESAGSQSHNMNDNYNPNSTISLGGHDQDMGDDDSDLVVMMQGKWSPSSFLTSLHTTNGLPHEHQFTDFQLFGKPWDFYNTHNLC